MEIKKIERTMLLKIVKFDERINKTKKIKYQKLSKIIDNPIYQCFSATEDNEVLGYIVFSTENNNVQHLVVDKLDNNYSDVLNRLLSQIQGYTFDLEVPEEDLDMQVLLRDKFGMKPIINKNKKFTYINNEGNKYYLMRNEL